MRERAGGAITRAKQARSMLSKREAWKTIAGRTGAVAVLAGALAAGALTSGCAVSDNDIHHWESTEHGPDNLYKVMVHQKFAWELRVEAAMTLIHMKPRAGQHLGLDLFLKALHDQQMTTDARNKMVADVVPRILPQMDQHAPPPNADGTLPPDPSVPYKDAAFALLTEPGLLTDDALKQQVVEKLAAWVQTDFELRIDNRLQQYGIEQMDRTLGAPSVKALPALIREDGQKNENIVALVAELGDQDTKKAASAALVALAQKMESKDWLDKQRALVEESNRRANTPATPQQVDQQLKDYQKGQLEPVFGWLKKIGQRPAVEYCVAFGADKSKNVDLRKQALAALENNIDKSNAPDVDRIFKIFADDTNANDIRGLALARLSELSKDQVVPKLYSTFNNFKIRLDAGQKILEIMKPMDAKAVDDFMKHLPTSKDQKLSATEGIAFGANLAGMGKETRDAARKYLNSHDTGPRLVAMGTFYNNPNGNNPVTAADAAPLKSSCDDDQSAFFKCDDADNCGDCLTPKEKGGGSEIKKVHTFAEVAKICIEPWLAK